jgi:hypothetical protein
MIGSLKSVTDTSVSVQLKDKVTKTIPTWLLLRRNSFNGFIQDYRLKRRQVRKTKAI